MGYEALTITVGGVMSGYCAIGRLLKVNAPASTIATAMTIAKIGRSMKNRENIFVSFEELFCDGFHGHAVAHLEHGGRHVAVGRFKARGDNAHGVVGEVSHLNGGIDNLV